MKLHFVKKIILAVVIMFNLAFIKAHSETLEISITEGEVKKTSIAISKFYSTDKAQNTIDIIANINGVITNNLSSSGLFEAIDKDAFIESPEAMKFRPNFNQWKPLDIEVLVTGNVKVVDSKYRIEVNVWDVHREKQMLAKKYLIAFKSWRRLSHLISDDIYTRITGETGYFDSRILFVSEQKTKKRRIKKVAVMDSDGANVKYITSGKYIALTPRFSPDQQHIAYMSYKRGVPSVYLHNIRNGKIKFLGQFKNMTYAPQFSPDGKRLIFSYAENGMSNIWEKDIATGKFQQITNNNHIDTSPSYSPDGKYIVFTSNRGGSAQVHLMDLSTRAVKRLSAGNGSYTTPIVSPRGDLIAFTKQDSGKFYIGVMKIDGTGERLIASSFLDEGPSFSPNGRTIIFFRKDINTGLTKLMAIDITGYNLRQVKTPYGASDPNWSTLNKR